MSEPAAHAYFAGCVGRWRAPLDLCIHDASALRASGMGLVDRWSLRAVAAWVRWAGGVTLDTSVAVLDPETVVHTTVVRFGPMATMRSEEVLRLDPDGRRFVLQGVQRMGGRGVRVVRGNGQVDEDGRGAHYALNWLGAPLRQDTRLEGDTVTLTQAGPGWRGVQRLRRR